MAHLLRMVVLALVVGAVFTGCDTAQPGVKNRFGTFYETLAGEPEEVTTAAARTLEDMKLIIIENKATQLDGRVKARTARDEEVTVDVKRAGEGASTITLRIGNWGDEGTSLTILERIKKKLEAK